MKENESSSSTGFEVAPKPDTLVHSLRAFGYKLTTAIADIVDNSIAAGAKNVWIEFIWRGPESSVSIIDDGHGMNPEKLTEAMRLGTMSPLETRESRDLGRFGLGMKTASFSQCRRLVVASKTKEGEVSTRCWDLDVITEKASWYLLSRVPDGSLFASSKLCELESGTIVYWEKLDRVTADNNDDTKNNERDFFLLIEAVEKHLSMVFHRFIERGNLNIWINAGKIVPWNPFIETLDATQKLPEETISFRGERLRVMPFVLPHHSKLSGDEFEKASGINGWNGQQGFYLYRNRRLIIAGDWFGLFKKEEHYKLARIAIEIPNNLDFEWQIDIRKSKAMIPLEIRNEIRQIARKTRESAVRVYRFRGKSISRVKDSSESFVWNVHAKHGRKDYRINRHHPIVKELIDEPDSKRVQSVLRLIEESVPVQLMKSGISETEASDVPTYTVEELKELFHLFVRRLQQNGNISTREIENIWNIEPFCWYKNDGEIRGKIVNV